jgi:hypothetical protein
VVRKKGGVQEDLA